MRGMGDGGRKMDLPSSWAVLSLGEMGNWIGGGTPSKAEPTYWQHGTIPWVSPKDMKTARISDAEDHITKRAVSESATNLVPRGSVLLVTRSGILGHTLPVAVTTGEVALNQDLKALVPKPGLDPEFIAAAIRALANDILHECSKHGTTVQSIEFDRFKEYLIPIAPEAEQERIVAKLDELSSDVDAGVANLERARALLRTYHQAVLKAAVTGELTRECREKHGGRGETGAELLQRILDAHGDAGYTGKSRKRKAKGKPKDAPEKVRCRIPVMLPTQDYAWLPKGWIWATLDQLSTHPPGNGISIKGSDLPPGIQRSS